jgi:protein gp37
MQRTDIEWCDMVWNPITGCTPASAGCAHCYASRIAKRFWRGRPFSEIRFHENRLCEPSTQSKPKVVFAVSMGDLFHPNVETFIQDDIFEAMQLAEHHQFIVLTKRPGMMWTYVRNRGCPSNVHLGVSIEDYENCLKRICIPPPEYGRKQIVSFEPLLGDPLLDCVEEDKILTIDWMIVGAETGAGARPMPSVCIPSMRAVADAYNIPWFFKKPSKGQNFGDYITVRQVPNWHTKDGVP